MCLDDLDAKCWDPCLVPWGLLSGVRTFPALPLSEPPSTGHFLRTLPMAPWLPCKPLRDHYLWYRKTTNTRVVSRDAYTWWHCSSLWANDEKCKWHLGQQRNVSTSQIPILDMFGCMEKQLGLLWNFQPWYWDKLWYCQRMTVHLSDNWRVSFRMLKEQTTQQRPMPIKVT